MPPSPPAVSRSVGDDNPWKPRQGIRIVVPAAPGGTTDIIARLLAALRAASDGYTVLRGNSGTQSIGYSLYRNMPHCAQLHVRPPDNIDADPNG